MSTRRARIKAVAVLPPRRKNVESDTNKIKPNKDVNDPLRSPKSVSNERSSASSPGIKSPVQASVIKSPVPSSPKPKSASETIASQKHIIKEIDKEIDSILNKIPVPLSPKTKCTSEKLASPKQNVIKEVDSIIKSPIPIFNSPRYRDSTVRKVSESDIPSSNSSLNEDSKKSNDVDASHKIARPLTDVVERSNQGDNINPTTPASVSKDAVLDDIIPIQPTGSVPHKSIGMLKNENISENTEVSFDPIVPLPSPGKVRLKLKPVPRLGPHRRNSIQGSASESEDESRRAALLSGGGHTPALTPRQRHDSQTLQSVPQSVPNRETNRVRNDSVCSNLSQAQPQPPLATSPVKEKHLTKARRQEMSKRMWRRRRETSSQALTMYDLIFFNPTSNPIVPDEDEVKAKEENLKEEAERKAKKEEAERKGKKDENKEDVDDPPEPSAAPVPQIKLGPNGEIVLDEASLVIQQSETRKVSSVVREGAWGGGGGRYRRAPRTADWSAAETVRFYRALAALGTDFSLMAQLFPDRSRRELKLKFKKEERLNGFQVDKALRSATTWDVAQLESDFREERAEAVRKAEEEKRRLVEQKQAEKERLKTLKDLKQRTSKASKAVENKVAPNTKEKGLTTADEFIERALEQKRRAELDPSAPKRRRIRVSMSKAESTINPEFATLTPSNKAESTANKSSEKSSEIAAVPTPETEELATISRVSTPNTTAEVQNEVPDVPPNIESGSLVVLRVNDPKSPSKTMLQTYISRGSGKLTPIALPPSLLNSVMGYMTKKKSSNSISSPPSQILSPVDLSTKSRSPTPGVIQACPDHMKRQRHNSYNITSL